MVPTSDALYLTNPNDKVINHSILANDPISEENKEYSTHRDD